MRILRKTLIAAILASGMVITTGLARTGSLSQDVSELVPGATIERELSGGETHTYRIALIAGQYTRVSVERQIVNITVAVSGPNGQEIIKVGRNHQLRPDRVSIVAQETADYHLIVSAPGQQNSAGRYRVRIDELRDGTPADEKRFAAEKLVAEGDRLRGQRTADSLRGAIEKYEESLANWRAIEDSYEEALTLNFIGMIHRALGDSRKALDYYGQSLPLFRISGDRLGEAETLNNMATAHYALGDIQEALNLLNQALPILREIEDRQGESSTLNNLGSIYWASGEPLLALDYYNQALPLYRALKNRRSEALALNNIGTVYSDIGDLQQALESYLQALSIRRETGDRRGEGITLANIGLIYHSLCEPARSLDYFEQALTLRRVAGDRRGEGYVFRNLGLAYWSLGDYQKALQYNEQALSVFREVGDRRGEAQVLNNLGMTYTDLGNQQKAIAYNGQALAIYREVGDRRGQAQSLDALGRAHAREGEPDKAIDHHRKALAIRRAIKHPGGEAQSLLGLAEVERERGNIIEARALMESALGIIESLRGRVAAEDMRASYLATNRAFYDFHIDLLMAMHNLHPSKGHDAEALEASESARARALLDSLAEVRADLRQGVDQALLQEERALEQRLNAKESYRMQLLGGKHTREQLTKVEREMQDLLARYQSVQAQIRATSPRYAALIRPAPASLAEIRQQVLDSETLLLEYALGRRRSFLWAVTSNSITSFELPPREEIESVARRVYELLTVSHRRQRKREGEIAMAELSRMLLGPVAKELKKKRLLIVADGVLHYVPFAALPVPLAQASVVSSHKDFFLTLSVAGDKASNLNLRTSDNYRPLIVEHEVINLPSASVLALMRRELKGRKPASRTVAVLADPVFHSGDLRASQAGEKLQEHDREVSSSRIAEGDLGRSTRETGFAGLERLPFTRMEAEAILAMAGERGNLKALDFDASRAMATGPELAEYRIVHFATHGLINSLHPQLSGIVLSLLDEGGRPQEGFLRVHDIYNMKLSAELVVLSGCRTALGKEIRGEGVVGLVRGFMYAGAPRVVASLWDVRDEATSELMKRFYEKMLKERLTAAAALRAAQVEMWKEERWRAPYYWAGFVLQGEWR
ncbi:MAG: tetratricopeptide repeat protein [Blastocatellia bacterium]|nr:tetratricopeptide repeat protein [Blastocatellia bacterium]